MVANNSYEEKKLLLRCVDGDELAFKTLFLTYWDRIHASILHICKQPAIADDLAQEVFIKIWQFREKLATVETFNAFLFKVAKNLVIDEFRKKILPAYKCSYSDSHIPAIDTDVAAQFEEKELEFLLLKSVDKLPPQMRRVFTLHRFEGLSHQQIAEKLQISRVSSQTYMTRAITQLRKILSEYKGEIAIIAVIIATR